MLHKNVVLAICIGICHIIALCATASVGSANITDFLLHRQKRFLIFQNNGVVKLTVGDTIPVDFGDGVVFRGVTISNNVQGGQYELPTRPIYAWDKWEATFARRMQQQPLVGDDSRLFVYTAMERFMDLRGKAENGSGDQGGAAAGASHGRVCLLRAICENAQVAEHIGIVAEVLNIVLTPGKEHNIDAAYAAAYRAGDAGADCQHLYHRCPSGANFLDQYVNYW